MRNLKSQRIQCDEIWSFIGAKQKNVTADQKRGEWGDVLDVDGDRRRYQTDGVVRRSATRDAGDGL